MIAARRAKALAIRAASGAKRCMGLSSERSLNAATPFSVRGCKRTRRGVGRSDEGARPTADDVDGLPARIIKAVLRFDMHERLPEKRLGHVGSSAAFVFLLG
jgi:hypothetical protein